MLSGTAFSAWDNVDDSEVVAFVSFAVATGDDGRVDEVEAVWRAARIEFDSCKAGISGSASGAVSAIGSLSASVSSIGCAADDDTFGVEVEDGVFVTAWRESWIGVVESSSMLMAGIDMSSFDLSRVVGAGSVRVAVAVGWKTGGSTGGTAEIFVSVGSAALPLLLGSRKRRYARALVLSFLVV